MSIPRSPRRDRLLSRPHHRSRHSKSRDRSRLPSRAPSVTLRSASPRRREVLHMAEMMITLVMISTIHQPLSNLHLGTINITTLLQRHIRTTTTPTTDRMINLPPTSGNHGVNGNIIPRPPTTLTHQAGSTTQSQHTRILPTTILHQNLHPNLSRLSLQTTLHKVTANTHVDLAQSNLGRPPSLQGTFPSMIQR